MKKILMALLAVIAATATNAQVWTGTSDPMPVPARVDYISGNAQSSVLKMTVPGFTTKSVLTPRGTGQFIDLEGTTRMLVNGAPDLPKMTASLVIPDNAHMTVQVTNATFVEYHDMDIVPSKGNLTRDVDPATVPYTFGTDYAKNQFYPGKLADLKDPFILRDLRGQTVVFYPFQYNPVTRTLRVYTDIEVSVTQSGPDTRNVLTRTKAPEAIDPEFSAIYNHEFLNYSHQYKYTQIGETGNMLIICYGPFMSAMQPFVDWKITEGIHTDIVDVASIGVNTTAIKNYVANYYDSLGLTFLLLVGDAAQIPTLTAAGGGSDPSYGYILGSDHYQEILVGRFSAENVAQVQTQVERSVNYEKTPSTTAGIFNHAVGIGSSQGPGDDSEYDYTHQRNILTDLLGFTYDTRAELFDGSQGGVDASGDATAAELAAEINKGTGIITYTGHGADDSFVTTGFSNSSMTSLTNNEILPFIWSVACVNGNFTAGTCFAEAWMRYTYNNQPAGAIATLMSTINQSWNPPMEGQDEMVDILTESIAGNIKRTFGGLSVNGIFKMNDTYSDFNMTDTWTIFGDPSLMVRTDDPASMVVTHTPTLNIGATSLVINCNTDGALVCLTMNHEILGTAYVSGGTAQISFPAVNQIDTITVCATAFNYVPYLGSVLIANTSGPYVVYASNTIQDASGNNNALVDFGETINLDMTLHNYGSVAANAVTADLSTTDAYITLTDNNQGFGNINAGADAVQAGAYAFTAASDIPDQHVVQFALAMQDNAGGSWNGNFSLTVNAPDLAVGSMTIDDASGNNNGSLDIGETTGIVINTLNNGHSAAPGTLGVLTTGTPQWISINSGSSNLGTLAVSGNADATFNITVSPTAPDTAIVELIYTVNSGAYSTNYHYLLSLGQASEDWETGDFTRFSWTQGGDVPWVITNVQPQEGVYCAKSGTISDNQTSTLSVTLNVLADDSISFWKKVSSEADYDFLSFYIDNAMQDQWSGTVAWSKEAYPVTAGNHTFKWEYAKDVMIGSGSDCAWLDYILFPPTYTGFINVEEPEQGITTLRCSPNPASAMTLVQFTTIRQGNLSLKLMDITGRVVADLASEQHKPAGTYSFLFNAADYPSGLYYVSLNSGGEIQSAKLIIVK